MRKILEDFAKFFNGKNLTEVTPELINDFIEYTKQDKVLPILIIVSEYLNIPISDILGRSRKKEIIFARHFAMYFVKIKTNLSFNDAGKPFDREHASVMHSVKTIKNLCDTYPNYKKYMDDLEKLIK